MGIYDIEVREKSAFVKLEQNEKTKEPISPKSAGKETSDSDVFANACDCISLSLWGKETAEMEED